ncbi:MAG: hypothetical protein OHK0029_09350 [Armatimonadaceae bacterium]
MNKQQRQAVSVGIFTFIVIGVAVGVVLFLRGSLAAEKRVNVIFDNAFGIQSGEPVQLSGVPIGRVESVELTPDSQAVLHLAIRDDVQIPENSVFRIKSGILGNSRTVAIEPAAGTRAGAEVLRSGATVTGDSSAPIDETLAETKKLVEAGQELVASVARITGDPTIQQDLKRTLANTVAITANLEEATGRLPEFENEIKVLLRDLQRTTAVGQRAARNVELLTQDARFIAQDARKLTRGLDATVEENRQQLNELLVGANDAANALATLLTSVNDTLTGEGTQSKVQAILANGQEASRNVVTATEQLNQIAAKFDRLAANFEQLSGDEQLVGDIKATVGNLKETSASVRNLAERIEGVRLPWERGRQPRPADTTEPPPQPLPPPAFSTKSLIEPGLVFDATYDTTGERFRLDGGYTLITGSNNFYRLGIADATEGNRLNLQAGWYNGSPATLSYRYGIFAGKLGVGLDTRPGPFDLRLDFYDPNRFTMDARAKIYLNRQSALTVGVQEIGKENRAVLGVQILR